MPNVNGKMFKNNQPQKKKVNPNCCIDFYNGFSSGINRITVFSVGCSD